MPERIQLRRTKGWRKPEGAIVVARPSRWGNPFTMSSAIEIGYAKNHDEARAFAVQCFRAWLSGDDGMWSAGHGVRREMLACLPELAGHDLACWCPLNQPCHADVLLELANGGGGRG